MKRDTDKPRADFRDAVGCCMVCGEDYELHVHEIANGPAREAALYRQRLQLVLCADCHSYMSDKALWPVAAQLAARLRWEIVESIEELAEVRGDRLVRLEDVLQWLR